ncbi:acyl-CoA dehydrogenase family member 10 [Xylariaceae sp. FL0255]|nr:acyl-CoA dehydrogenase family member 10 [Xylariaceae sp. FL0255]
MSPTSSTVKPLEGPAFERIPPWVQQILSPLAIEKIQAPLMHELREKAKARGLFNLFLTNHFKESPGLTNLEYACCAEIMGRVYWVQQTMNYHAPETGNIELLIKYCNEEQKKWLVPLVEGKFSSAYSMTEPDVASSDATNIGIRIKREGDEYFINGRNLYGNCLWNKELAIYILMGCSDPENPNKWGRHTMIIVPANTPGITQVRNLTIMGYDHAPEGHGEYVYENVRVPAENIILGEGRAFEIARGRLGPGRIHHCMRLIGQCERAYELALIRCTDPRKKPHRCSHLIVLNAADTMDLYGNKAGKRAIAQSKIIVPSAVCKIVDECMQIYGGQDGPDAAHRHEVGREEMKSAAKFQKRYRKYDELYKKICGARRGEIYQL